MKKTADVWDSELGIALGAKRGWLLLEIAKHTNDKGECHVTVEELSKSLEWNFHTVEKWLNSLLEFRWNGEPIITRTKERRFSRPVFHILLPNGNAEVTVPKQVPTDVKQLTVAEKKQLIMLLTKALT